MNSVHFETNLYPKPLAHFSSPKTFDLHLHKHVEFVCVMSGEFSLRLGDKEYHLTPHDAVFIAPYTLHSYRPLSDDAVRFVLVFEPEATGSLGQLLLENIPAQPIIPADTLDLIFPTLSDTLTDLTNYLPREAMHYLRFYNNFIGFLDHILHATGLKEKPQVGNNLFPQAVSLCSASFTDASFSLDALATALYSSPSHIKQLFAKNMHMSVKKYLTLLRVGRAEFLLEDDGLSVVQIAQNAGFGSVRTFNRVFKEQKGITPQAYKAALRQRQGYTFR